jgi:malate/lactate dehydrogenase
MCGGSSEAIGATRVAVGTLRGIADGPRKGGQDILRGKGATNYGISAASTRIATTILRDKPAVLTVSTLVPERRWSLGK